MSYTAPTRLLRAEALRETAAEASAALADLVKAADDARHDFSPGEDGRFVATQAREALWKSRGILQTALDLVDHWTAVVDTKEPEA